MLLSTKMIYFSERKIFTSHGVSTKYIQCNINQEEGNLIYTIGAQQYAPVEYCALTLSDAGLCSNKL
jgi:hypothetical protein